MVMKYVLNNIDSYRPLIYNGYIYAWRSINSSNTAYKLVKIKIPDMTVTEYDTGLNSPSTDGHYNIRNVLIDCDNDNIVYGMKARWETLKILKFDISAGSANWVEINTLDSDLNYPRGISPDGKYLYWWARGCNSGGYGVCWRLYRVPVCAYDDPQQYEKITTFVNDTSLNPSQHTYCVCEWYDKLYCACANRNVRKVIAFILGLDGKIYDLNGNLVANSGESVTTNDQNLLAIDMSNLNIWVRPGPVYNFNGLKIVIGCAEDQNTSGKIRAPNGDILDSGVSGTTRIFADSDGLYLCGGHIGDWSKSDCRKITINTDWSITLGNIFTDTDSSGNNYAMPDPISDSILVTKDKKTMLPIYWIYASPQLIIPNYLYRGAIAKISVSGGTNSISYTFDFDEYGIDVDVCIDNESNCKSYSNISGAITDTVQVSAGTHNVFAKSKMKLVQTW